MSTLSQSEIIERLGNFPEWRLEGGTLVRDYSFADFTMAFAFVVRVALLAEKANHHPDIDVRYNKVRLALVSHDAGGVTSRDLSMAGAISQMQEG
jgi:4a-hydroxytetrahydrobiopterin dehydratase